MMIDIHADDFAESIHSSNEIIECLKAGKLDSISVLSNMHCFQECVNKYREAEPFFEKKPFLSVHINIIEGRPLSKPEEVPLLLNTDGYFGVSWVRLFLKSFLPGRTELKNEIKGEVKVQVRAVKEAFPECMPLRIDSHQHTHMIPVVADAVFETIKEEGWEIAYIRDAREPILPFLAAPSLYKTYKPINFLKNIILKFCSLLLKPRLQKIGQDPMYLWGLIMSGYMDEARVNKLFYRMKKIAMKRGKKLEILFHPGRVLEEEISSEFNKIEAVQFYTSRDREIEKMTVMSGKWE